MFENRGERLEKLLERYSKLKVPKIIMQWEEKSCAAKSLMIKERLHYKALLGQKIVMNVGEIQLYLEKNLKELYKIQSGNCDNYIESLEGMIETIGFLGNEHISILKQISQYNYEHIDKQLECLIEIQIITFEIMILNMLALFEMNFNIDYEKLHEEVENIINELIGLIPGVGEINSIISIMESLGKIIEYNNPVKSQANTYNTLDEEAYKLELELTLLNKFNDALEETIKNINKQNQDNKLSGR